MQFAKIIHTHTHTLCHKCSVLVWWAWRCTSTSSLASTIARLNYHQTTVVSFKEYSEKQIPFYIISQATRRCSFWRGVQYNTRDYSELIWVYSEKDTSYITGKWWTNSVLIKKRVSSTLVFIILSIPVWTCRNARIQASNSVIIFSNTLFIHWGHLAKSGSYLHRVCVQAVSIVNYKTQTIFITIISMVCHMSQHSCSQ